MIHRDALNRRCLLSKSAALTMTSLAVAASPRLLPGATPEIGLELLETQVISRQAQYYHGWPTLARRRNGELLVVCSGGREAHVCPFGRVELIRSRDEGRTWTYPRVVYDGPLDDRDAGCCETNQGTLLITTFTSTAYVPTLEKLSGDKLERWMSVHNRVNDEQRERELGVWILRSTDNGITWSARQSSIVGSPHGPVAVRDGRVLYAGIELYAGQRRVGVCESRDDGQSWQWLAAIPTRAGDNSSDYHELHMLECNSGKLIAHIRNHNANDNRETLQTESTDGGRSWSQPHSIGVWGLPSHLLRLRDGRLLMSYGYRRQPFGNQVRLSHDEGVSWSPPLTISADGASGDLGYPSTVELSDGSLLTVWYERLADNPAAVLRAARWRLA